MPNYCENDLYIYGPEHDLINFLEYAKGEVDGTVQLFDLSRFVPLPPDAADEDQARVNSVWLLENWGTKSNALWTSLDDVWIEPDLVKLTFSTCWSPPTPVVLAASKMFPSLRLSLEYYECGIGFHGRYSCEHGQEVEDLVGPYYGSRGG